MCRVADQVDATEIHIATDISAYAQRRQQHLAAALDRERRKLVCHDAVHTVLPAGAVTPQRSDHFAVFTPYHRRWATAARRTITPPPHTNA